MKKALLGIFLFFISCVLIGQGLEDVIVEKTPVSTAAIADDANLTSKHFAYRVFLDLAEGYEVQAIFSLENHEMFFQTTTKFYNNADFGATTGRDILSALLGMSASLAYDSYITLDAAANNRLGVLRAEDTQDGTVDGLVTGTSLPLQTIGANFSTPFGTEMYSGKFSTNAGIYNVIGGEQGPTAVNKVLIGQFTTDGDFSFEINVQIRPVGSSSYVQYVAQNPTGNQILSPKLIYSSAGGAFPVVSIVSPANGASFNAGEKVPISATATDADGTVSMVEFYVNDAKVGEDATAPYQYEWTAVAGNTQLSARARDNQGNVTTSSPVTLTVNNPNLPPVITITAPANGASYVAGSAVNLVASATDSDGSITKVEFFVGGIKAGEDLTSPYSFTWTAVAGSAQITAVATDNSNNHTTSAAIGITVNSQSGEAPTVNITAPTEGAKVAVGSVVSISANAADAGGSVTRVEFYINGAKIGEDLTSPYQASWTAVKGSISLTARATDNEGNSTLSAVVTITVGENTAPYATVTAPVNGSVHNAGSQITIDASASDVDGTIILVEFFRNGEKIGEDATAPYQYIWTSVGGLCVLTATATDNNGMKNSSPQVVISVTGGTGNPPVVSITAPVNSSVHNAGSIISISAEATDGDGTIAKVEFLNNGVKLGEDNTAPYGFNWTSTPGNASLTARAIDNSGNQTTSAPVSIVVNGSSTSQDTLVFDFSTAIINNNHYQLPVSVLSSGNVTSFSFSTVLNTSKIAFHEVVNHTNYLTNTSDFDQTAKKLTVNSTGSQSVEKNKKLVSISFTLLTGAVSSGDLTQFQAYVNNKKCEVKLIFSGMPIIPPTVSITSPAAGTEFKAGNNIAIAANAADTDGSITLVEFYADNSKVGEDAAAPYQFNWTGIAGTPALTARATDNKGNQTTSAPVTINITSGSGNQLPVVAITAPANNAEFSSGITVSITASASDPDGSVSYVEFFVNDIKISKVTKAPYQVNWIAANGNSVIKVIATDNKGAKSAPASVNVVVNAQPSVSLTAPVEGAKFTAGNPVTFIATTQNGSGSIVLVEFFVNGVKVGQDDSSPFEYTWISVPGEAKVSALVTDSKGAKTTSNTITVSVNAPPVVSISAPSEGSIWLNGDIVGIAATASDPDGSVKKVEFLINGKWIATDSLAPYAYNWKSYPGSFTLTVAATDNKGSRVISEPVIIEVINAYELNTTHVPCSDDKFCISLEAINSIKQVIGFDLKMEFDPTKVKPTGSIHIADDLINPAFADYQTKIDQSKGIMNISIYLKSSAPDGTSFIGTGNLICVEFEKKEAFQSLDTVAFGISLLRESYITGVISRTVLPGEAISYKDYNFRGSLKYWSDNRPISYNRQNPGKYLITDIMGTNASDCSLVPGSVTQPDESGMFLHDVRKGNALTFSRDILPTTEVQSAINGMDAQLALKIALGDNSVIPSAFQILSSDVNLDGVVSSGDVSQINQRSILMINEYKQAWNYDNSGIKVVDEPSKDWLFVNEKVLSGNLEYKISSNYPEPDGSGFDKLNVPEVPKCQAISFSDKDNCPMINPESFVGIMLGDINGNYGTQPADGKLKSTLADEDLVVFDMAHAQRWENKMEFPVYINSNFSVISLDFQFKFRSAKIEYDTIINLTGYIEPTFFLNDNDSTLRFTSFSMLNYQSNKNLVTIRFDLLQENILETDLYNIKAWLNGDSVAYEVTEYNPTVDNKQIAFEPEVVVYPNPASHTVWIKVSADASVEVIDQQGRIHITREHINANEEQQINIERLTSGMYILRFIADNQVIVRKLLINR